MERALIQLAYRQVITEQGKSPFEQNAWLVSYNEFLLKSQAYNLDRKFNTFREMVNNDGRANSLHYKLSFPVLPFIEQLQKKIPLLKDNAGKNIVFDTWQFELVDSDIRNRSQHTIAIHYHTDIITVIETLGEYMLLASGDRSDNLTDIPDCFVLKMQDRLSITKFQQLPEPVHV
ncbi:MAG TPA: hypothetical protein VFW07_24070 [Parafilimonas sp.]|nr:hypothetical protein [Parafilimonas sp.]